MRLYFDTVMEYAVIVMKEAIAGLLIGFGANICMAIVNFAGIHCGYGDRPVHGNPDGSGYQREYQYHRCVISVFFYVDADRFRNVPLSVWSAGGTALR